MVYGVITRVADPATGGNLASAMDLYQQVEEGSEENGWLGRYERVNIMAAMHLRTPVFEVGEILILNESGREYGFPGRKPSKWDVDCEEFTDFQEAVKRSEEVFDESLEAIRNG